MSGMDILEAIDAAVGCQHCGATLRGSVSDDFCCQDCQTAWHAEQAVQLVGYREPWYDDELPGVSADGYRPAHPDLVVLDDPPEWRLPRSTGNLAADWLAANHAARTATTDAQRAAVRLRTLDLTERSSVAMAPLFDAMREAFVSFGEGVREIARSMGEAFAKAFPPPDGRDALTAPERPRGARRQHGPPPRGRAPRTIGRPHTSARR